MECLQNFDGETLVNIHLEDREEYGDYIKEMQMLILWIFTACNIGGVN